MSPKLANEVGNWRIRVTSTGHFQIVAYSRGQMFIDDHYWRLSSAIARLAVRNGIHLEKTKDE